jgi:DNA-binding CsgD family transcriptional regulator
MKFLVYDCYANEIRKVLFGEKCPFFDDRGKIIGVMCNVFDISNLKLLDLGQLLINFKKKSSHSLDIYDNFFCYKIEQDDFKYDLSPRQQECLFFIIRGKTAKMVAQELNISYKTVEIYIEQIKNKLNCSSKNDLIEKAMADGYMNIIPSSLFSGLSNTNITV